MDLNSDQSTAFDWIVSNVLEGKEPYMTLVGAGGTGKTYSVMAAVAKLQEAGLKVLLTAPTNKAVKQLQRAAEKFGLSRDNVAFQTIHSALGLAMLPNEDQKFAARAGRGVIGAFDVVVIDEASMLSRILLHKYLIPDCEQHNTKLLFMGDDLQLPPVREKVSEVFSSFPSIRLEKNERTAEGELLSMNTLLRDDMMANRPFKAPTLAGEQVKSIKAAHFLGAILDSFEGGADLDSQRVLAWTNRRVNEVNAAVRNRLFGKNCARYVEGERVVTGSPVKDGEDNVALGTDEECEVTHVNENSFVYDDASGLTLTTTQLVLKPLYVEGQVIVDVLNPDGKEAYDDRLSELADAARADQENRRRLWKQFWSFKEQFADIRHCYCITIHRSQGSTFDKVFVDVKDILKNNNRVERQRLLYVGYSRPRSELMINKINYTA